LYNIPQPFPRQHLADCDALSPSSKSLTDYVDGKLPISDSPLKFHFATPELDFVFLPLMICRIL
jgi:hypothetical protein